MFVILRPLEVRVVEPLFTTKSWALPVKPQCGKVRETYKLEDGTLLVVATDRISAFDVVSTEPIPHKGRVLTEMSIFWFQLTSGVIENHLISTDLSGLEDEFQPYRGQLAGRSMIVKCADVFPIEWVVRGYLAGSGWKEYQQSQTVCGITLPAGLKESDRLPRPILTPATKAVGGLHDENISPARTRDLVGEEVYHQCERASLEVYQAAADHAISCGIIIADTKFEFGWYDGREILVDEVLTPDSSRFWPVGDYQPGRSQPSLDKQPLRDYLEGLGWDKQPPMPPLPDEVVTATSARYLKACDLLIGTP